MEYILTAVLCIILLLISLVVAYRVAFFRKCPQDKALVQTKNGEIQKIVTAGYLYFNPLTVRVSSVSLLPVKSEFDALTHHICFTAEIPKQKEFIGLAAKNFAGLDSHTVADLAATVVKSALPTDNMHSPLSDKEKNKVNTCLEKIGMKLIDIQVRTS